MDEKVCLCSNGWLVFDSNYCFANACYSGVLPDSFTGEQLGLLRAEAQLLCLPELDQDLCSRVKVFGVDFPMSLNRVDLSGLDLSGYDLSGRELVECRFNGKLMCVGVLVVAWCLIVVLFVFVCFQVPTWRVCR